MLRLVKKVFQDLLDGHQSQRTYIPKSAPSAEEAILPFDPADYSIDPEADSYTHLTLPTNREV